MMNKNLIEIKLSETQIETAKWLLDCPLFYTDAEALEWDWDITPERAKEIMEAVQLCKVDGNSLVLCEDGDVLVYIKEYAEQFADMASSELKDELIATTSLGLREIQCKVNAAVKSAEALAEKLGGAL